MGRFYSWVARQLSNSQSSPLWRLFLTGVKGQLDSKAPKPYNYYLKIISGACSVAWIYYFLLFTKNQMDIKGHNFMIPDYIYRVREENYIYWQTVRLAKDMPTLLTYYHWDDNLMFEIDRTGKQTPLQAHKGIENSQTFQSPLHEYNFPASPQTHARILMYLRNINNPYDMGNYLRAKPVVMGDWLRGLYYGVYRGLGLSNRWRYDEYVRKPDVFYRWEKIKLAFFLGRDRDKLYETLDMFLRELKVEDMRSFFIWFI